MREGHRRRRTRPAGPRPLRRCLTRLPDPEDLREQVGIPLDPYLDPFRKFSRNKMHARTATELAAAEAQLVWARSLELT